VSFLQQLIAAAMSGGGRQGVISLLGKDDHDRDAILLDHYGIRLSCL